MAVYVSGPTITMTHGDTLRLKIDIYDKAGNEYIPVEEDYIRFAVKKKYTDEVPLVLKEIPSDTCILHLEPSDTKHLNQRATLVYDIQITMSDGSVDTFISGTLIITPEVD